MTESSTRECAREGCSNRFELTLRSGRMRSNGKKTLHKGRRYCSDNCRKRASDGRYQPSGLKPKTLPKRHQAIGVASTVRGVENNVEISTNCEGQKSGRAPLQMTFGGYTVVPDAEWPKMYRVRGPDGSLTDMVNLTRARDRSNLCGRNMRESSPCRDCGRDDVAIILPSR
jgi:hypothetical protein